TPLSQGFMSTSKAVSPVAGDSKIVILCGQFWATHPSVAVGIIPIHVCRDLVPSNQVISQSGDRCASMTKDGCLQHDNVAHCIQKVPVTDGNGCSRPSPGCPPPWSPWMHKSAAGITGRVAGIARVL